MSQTVAELQARLSTASEAEFAVLKRSLCSDTRKGVIEALRQAQKRLECANRESLRVASLYSYQSLLAGGKSLIGLDEVGRGPLAGPLAVGAVILPDKPILAGLDDSKKVSPENRTTLALRIKETAIAWEVVYVEPCTIDKSGMTYSLKFAFATALENIEARGYLLEAILLDGNPLHLDEREISVVKGDTKCASIAAASIIAKVARDELMCGYSAQYPEYGFDSNKGYASPKHIEAIKKYGLSPIHRASFCTAFMQKALF